jgi:hypothetical protein
MHALEDLRKAYMFLEISKILGAPEDLFKYFHISENTKWNDLQSLNKKEEIRNKLKVLVCQQQQILRQKDISLKDILFPEIGKMNVIEDYFQLRLYLNSRLEYNLRYILNNQSINTGMFASKLFMDILTKKSTVVAITTDFNATISLLPAMSSREFWKNRSLINVDEVSYFPVKWGYNIALSKEIVKPKNILIAL